MTKSKLKIDMYGSKTWKNSKGEYHQENGPAVIYPNGSMNWCINGKYHRIDGPAIVWIIGDKSWWLNDIHIRSFQYD